MCGEVLWGIEVKELRQLIDELKNFFELIGLRKYFDYVFCSKPK